MLCNWCARSRKTLVGLNVAVQQFNQGDLAVYLSGNQPLVDVLTEALARDKKRQENEKNPEKHYTLTEARRNVKSFDLLTKFFV